MSFGACFVEYKGVTVRVSKDGKCKLSNISYSVLEWDLRTEPPSVWEYMLESDIKALGEEVYNEIIDLAEKVNKQLNE